MWILDAVSTRIALARLALLSTTSVLGLAVAAGSSLAACDNSTPASGQTVTCSGTGPFGGVAAATGSTAVTINVTSDAALTTNASSALVVQGSSSITNAGSLTVSGGSGSGRAALSALGDNNTLTNSGTIVTNGR